MVSTATAITGRSDVVRCPHRLIVAHRARSALLCGSFGCLGLFVHGAASSQPHACGATPCTAAALSRSPGPYALCPQGRYDARSRLPWWQPLRNHRRFAMRRLTLSLSLALVVLFSLGVSGRSTHAQDATPDPTAMMAMATHPVVGTWEMTGQITEDNTFPFLAIFHGDGTYMEIYPWGTIITGVWRHTGERTAEATAVSYYVVDDRLA